MKVHLIVNVQKRSELLGESKSQATMERVVSVKAGRPEAVKILSKVS